jgi:hypothetical protein
MSIEASRRGYAFATVKPRGDRNFEAHTVSIVFAIDEGPRVYIERSMFAATPAHATTSFAASSIFRKAMPITVRWSIVPSAA